MTKQITIQNIKAENVDKIVTVPAQTKMVKIVKSDSKDENKPSITELSEPYQGRYKLRFQHDKKYAGGISKLKKGYEEDLKSQDPVCGIKIFNDKEYKNRVKYAENEVKYNCLLEREAAWGMMNNKCYVLLPWIKGMNMHDYASHLKRHARDSKYVLPFKKPDTYTRLKMFRNYLRQAKIFHDLGLIWGDPKSGNCMVDIVNETFEIIDFDAVHPIGTKGTAYTHMYLPPRLIIKSSGIRAEYSQADDIYIFGLMLAELFPEVFNITYTKNTPTVITVIDQGYKELEMLVRSMTDTDPNLRPRIDDCLKRVDALLKIYAPKNLPEEKGKDKIDLLSEKIKEREIKILFEELCQSIENAKTERALVILKSYPEMLNKIWQDSKDQNTTPLQMGIGLKSMEIVEFAFKYALETADYKQVDFILKNDLSKQLLSKKFIGGQSPLTIAGEFKEDKNGDKGKIMNAILEKGTLLEDKVQLETMILHLKDGIPNVQFNVVDSLLKILHKKFWSALMSGDRGNNNFIIKLFSQFN